MDTSSNLRRLSSLIIFTDLDGTLLSETSYDRGPALPVLKKCRALSIPVIFCSSKTAAEIIRLREELGNRDPFICENGGAIYLTEGTFKDTGLPVKREDSLNKIEIGTPVSQLRVALREAAVAAGVVVKGMGEMSLKEVCALTGLGITEASLAMERRYDEPFILLSGNPEPLEERIINAGFTMTRGGRFFHILKGSDKGKAVHILSNLYKTLFDAITTVGIGDAANDLPMFRAVDLAFLVQKPSGKWASLPELPNLTKVEGIGPEGWTQTVSILLEEK
jgi:mannosyl-3-phosphoglycerate phosphatase